jgi:glutamine amidotransferase
MLRAHPYVYYVHSYCASEYDDADLIGYSMYGDIKVPGLVMKNNVMGTQFHPEKSAEDGLCILAYFAKEFS